MPLLTIAEHLARVNRAYLKLWLELQATQSVARIDARRADDKLSALEDRIRALEGRLPPP